MNDEVRDVLETLRVVAELPSDSFGAYVISMATAPSDVLIVELLQRECKVLAPLRVVPLFEKLADLESASACLSRLFSIDWYLNRINGKQEVALHQPFCLNVCINLRPYRQHDCIRLYDCISLFVSAVMIFSPQMIGEAESH